MKVNVSYNDDNVIPNDRYSYDESALKEEFRYRFENDAETVIVEHFPDAEVEFAWSSYKLTVTVLLDSECLSEEMATENRIQELLHSLDVWSGIDWDEFLISED